MALNTSQAVAKLRSLTHKFDMAVQAATPYYPELCTVLPSDGYDEEYAFLGAMPGVEEWLGDRQFAQVRAANFTLKNKSWENSIEVERERLEDDRVGIYNMAFPQLGVEAAYHPDELLFSVMEAGETAVCWDGQSFYDTDHAWGASGSQSNDLTHDATNHAAVTEAEFRTAYHKMRAAMLGFKRDNGKPYIRPVVKGMQGLVLSVPPVLEEVAHKAINKTLVDAGETNIVLDRPKIVVGTHLTSSVKIRLFNTADMLKPFVFQARRPITRQMKGLEDREFKNAKFMCDARYNIGYLAWWNAVQLEFT